MWDDLRTWAASRLAKAIPKQAADGEKFVFKDFMLKDLFDYYMNKYYDDHGDNRRPTGRWLPYNVQRGGARVLCAMLKMPALPERVHGGSIITIASINQFAYNNETREFRVRGVLTTRRA